MNPPTGALPTDQTTSVPAAPGLSEVLSQSLYDLIEQQPFFKGLNSQQLKLLTSLALEMKFEPGQAIFAQGSPANRFYLILEGEVVVESEKEDRNVIPIQTLGPGDALGWSWLFPPYYLHFSARAVKPTRTIFFFATPLREYCEQDHELGFQLMKRVAEVATQSLQVTQQRLMNHIATYTTAMA
jgi:CRP/FNR family cyclic AMP-dependent transcriptional regulator